MLRFSIHTTWIATCLATCLAMAGLVAGCDTVHPETTPDAASAAPAAESGCAENPANCQNPSADPTDLSVYAGDVPGIGMSNARDIFQHVVSIDNRANGGDGTLHWTQNAWGFDATGASHIVAYVAVPFPQHDSCHVGDPVDDAPKKKSPCHSEAFATFNPDGSWYVTADDSARYMVWADSLFEAMIARIRQEAPGATFTLVGREHGYCAPDEGRQHPEPFAGMHATLVQTVVARHADGYAVDLHQPSLDYGSGDGTPQGADCSYFKADGIHPGAGATYAAEIVQAHLDALPQGTGVEYW